MATASIIRQPASAGAAIERDSIRLFQFDVTEREQHSRSAVVSTHPVEQGADVADNVRVENPRLTLTGVVTNTPFAEVLTIPNRDFIAWETLARVLEDGRPVTVVTPLETYTSMVLVNLTCDRDRSTGQALRPTLVFERVNEVGSLVVEIPPEIILADDSGSASGGASEVDGGRGTTDAPNASEDEVAASWASQGVDGLSNVFGGF